MSSESNEEKNYKNNDYEEEDLDKINEEFNNYKKKQVKNPKKEDTMEMEIDYNKGSI